MANMFVPAAFDSIVKEEAAQLRRETDAAYVPEWEVLVHMLADEHQDAFRDRHDSDLSTIDVIAAADESTEDTSSPNSYGDDAPGV